MKKFILIFLPLLLLCGCQKTKPQYLISSIGFDSKDGQLITCFEAIIINSETEDQEIKLFEGKGETVEDGVKEIEKQCTQDFLLSHCGLFIVGETVNEKQLDNIYEFCFKKEEITLSARFVKAENAKKLLSQKPISTISVGYDILGLIEQYSKTAKIKNRYFEIEANEKKTRLPQIKLKEKGYYLEK
jgi:hypothetical protein